MKRIFQRCGRHQEAISLLAVGCLPREEEPAVRSHLAGCADCRRRFEEQRVLAAQAARLRDALPHATPGRGLRPRWQAGVRKTSSITNRPENEAFTWAGWLSGRRMALGALAGIWVLILFFHFSVPKSARPALVSHPPTWREVLLALKTESRTAQTGIPSGESELDRRLDSPPLPPRSERKQPDAFKPMEPA